jgi:hypothetical protein
VKHVTEATTSHGASGSIYLADQTGTQALLFGQCGADPSNITYRATVIQPGHAPQHSRLLARGNFPAVIASGILDSLGVDPLTITVQIAGKSFTADLTPDNSEKQNALIRTSDGLHGVAIETRSSPWAFVACLAIMVAGGITLMAIDEHVQFDGHATVDTPAGSAKVDLSVGGSGDSHDGKNGGGAGPS